MHILEILIDVKEEQGYIYMKWKDIKDEDRGSHEPNESNFSVDLTKTLLIL